MEGDLGKARSHVEVAARWILHASSQEHLCILHLVRARLANDGGRHSEAGSALFEGLEVARACRFGIYLIDLLNESARLNLYLRKPEAAEKAAREARDLAGAGEFGYIWGEALAVHYLHHALKARGLERRAARLLSAHRHLLPWVDRSPFLRDLKFQAR